MATFRRLMALLCAAVLALGAQVAAAQEFPQLTGRVVDAANILPMEAEAQLSAKLEALELQSQRQLVVVTLPSLQGYEISDYGYQLGRHWGIGDAERNDGALLIVAPNERKVRIEVGYGLEPVLTDGLSHLIVQNQIIPAFKQGDMAGGITAGADAIIAQLQLPEDQARQIAAQAAQTPTGTAKASAIGVVIWMIVIVFFILMAARRRGARRYGSDAIGNIILWEALNHMSGSRRSGGWGGGGFGGGGFSGGGGSFGGGGASGSW